MRLPARLPLSHRIVFLAAAALALAFALYTNHVWEDYYITFRSSRNLATGHGLVYNLGDRLHTFTSPLGVLLPALGSLLTLNRSDAAALWFFRAVSIAAFAGGAVLFYTCFRQTQRSAAGAAVAVGALMLDPKNLDFTINGMETGLLLFFIAATLWAQFARVERRSLWLGLSWAGLMWTRPDGFLYIGLLALGAWLFNRSDETGYTRREWLRTCAWAALICAALYLPWFLGTWWYYGTPVPHTVVAKSALTGHRPLLGALETMLKLPVTLWTQNTSLPGAFLPTYYQMGGWPAGLMTVAKGLAFVAAFAWLVPALGTSVRAASLGFYGVQAYLTYFPYFPFPWYLPGTTMLGLFVLGGVIVRLWRFRTAARPWLRVAAPLGSAIAALLLGLNLWTAAAAAREFAAQQRWIENGNRERIGLWLHQHAAPGDSVFLEPLGYIGYFSNLKTYDFPGMSSREVPKAIGYLGQDWVLLIEELQPTWLVLRPGEVAPIQRNRPSLLTAYYHPAQDFDVRDQVLKLKVRGRPLLEVDAQFQVFRRVELNTYETKFGVAHSPFPPGLQQIGGHAMVMVHAPGDIMLAVPASARSLTVTCGFVPGAGQGVPHSDGASFNVRLRDRGRMTLLSWEYIDPALGPDPHLHQFTLKLPEHSAAAELILQSDPGANSVKDWTCWSEPRFQ